ncbi:hypothetical protein PV761_09760 [Arthrobacter sp. CC3]|uniref:hypothetical protein n=1 Tax=Arthrobacter sp. CC3 TaxID=3029185 RepID=UPI0032670475
METLLRTSPREGKGHLTAALDRLQVNADECRELHIEGTFIGHGPAEEAERLIGGAGTVVHLRLGLEAEATPERSAHDPAGPPEFGRWRGILQRSVQHWMRAAWQSAAVKGVLVECAALQLTLQAA